MVIIETEWLPLFIDGEQHRITARDLSKSHTVAEFLHDKLGRSARTACGEGGCGACAVIVTRPVIDDALAKTLRFELAKDDDIVCPRR